MPRRQNTIRHITLALLLFGLVPASLTPSTGAQAQQQQPGKVRHYEGPPWLGFVADRQSKDALKVASVLKKSPASRAGLEAGDVVIEVEQVEVKRVRDLKIVLRAHKVGDTLEVIVMRGEKRIETSLTLAPTPTQKQLAKDQLIGARAPAFDVPGLDASTHKLADLEGKVTIIEFWATWCTPCTPFRKELTSLHARHDDAINILAISNEEAKILRPYIKKHEIPYAVGSDTAETVHDAYFVRALPLILILDKEHNVRKVITGDDDPALVSKSVQSLLKADEEKVK